MFLNIKKKLLLFYEEIKPLKYGKYKCIYFKVKKYNNN